MLVESVPNVSEGRRLDVVDRLAAAITTVSGAWLLDRTSDASHNRSVFTIAGEHEAVSEALERLVDAAIHDIDMDVHEGEHPRIGAVDVVPFVPLGGDDDGRLRRPRPRVRRAASRPASTCRSTSTPAPPRRPDREKLADVRRGQYEGLKAEIDQRGREPDFGPPQAPSLGRRGGRRGSAVPHRLQHQPRLATTSTWPGASPAASASRAAACRTLQANGFEVHEPERGHPVRAQVSMNLLDFAVTPLWLVWDSVRALAAEDGVDARRVGAHRAGPAGRLPGRGRSRRRARRGPSRARLAAAAALPPAARLPPRAGPRAPARGRQRRRGRPAMTGRPGPFRVIEGGRTGRADARPARSSAPREVVTMAGGVRRGPEQGEVGRLRTDDPAGPEAPVVACWEGRILAVGPRAAVEAALEGGGYPLARFARHRCRRRHRHARPRSTRTPTCCSPASREGELEQRQAGAGYLDILAAGGGILSTVAATRAASEADLLAHGRRWLDEMLSPRRHDDRGEVGLRAGPRDRAPARRRRRIASAGTDRSTSSRPGSARTPCPPECRPGRAARRPTSKSVIEEQLPGIAAHGRARFARRVLRDRRVHAPTSRGGSSRPPLGFGLIPRLHADELAPSGGAELAAEIGAASADHLATPSDDGIAALAAAAETDEPVVATLLPVTTWYLMKDHHAPARRFIDAGVPVAIGTDFNPGHLADRRACRWPCRSPASTWA